jgi:murein DD-endopeptidase MepM/ murein hydrolase activator NlpD
MKIKPHATIFLAMVSLGFFSPNIYAGSSERAYIASNLFKLPSSQINYDYNPWRNAWPQKDGKCEGYDGGHSGLDIQTKDKSTSRGFYALSGGKVISAGGKYNTIAVYDSINNRTVLYLHASRINVSVNQQINVGTLLGWQGDKGAPLGAFHVHVEVRSGSRSSPACGASSTINPETILSTPTNYDGLLPTTTGCDQDGTTVNYKNITGGKIELRWSNRCKTNWTRVTPTKSSANTSAKIVRNSDGRTYSYNGSGTIYTPMVYAPNTTSCASGSISGISGSYICR